MLDYYKKRGRLIIEKLLGKRLLPINMLPKGFDLYYDIKRHLDTNRFTVVFDVGSNEGQSIVDFANWFPNACIHGFEPANQPFVILSSKFSQYDRIKTHNFALGSAPGNEELSSGKNSERGSFHFGKTGDRVINRQQVKVKTIDSFCRVNEIDSVSFVKIDTEGHDLEVLRGAEGMLRSHAIDLIQIEATPDYENDLHVSLCTAIDYMSRFEYKIYGIYDQVEEWREDKKTLRRINAVFAKSSLQPLD